MADLPHSPPPAGSDVAETSSRLREAHAFDVRTGLQPRALRRAFADHLHLTRAHELSEATPYDRYVALSHAVRDRLVERWAKTQRTYYERDVKRAYYLSAEYLLGRALWSNLQALGIHDAYSSVLADIGVDLRQLVDVEPDAGLGNGGLGRLAACFLDSAATLSLPVTGYGIRYEFGIFEQVIRDGCQVERADEWLRFGNPWEIERPEHVVPVSFGGVTERVPSRQGGGFRMIWRPEQQVLGVPFDTPIAGYGSDTVNSLRLWSSRAGQDFDFGLFNAGDYVRAVEQKNQTEVISKVLYPNDNFEAGKELRLRQEYFFVACSIADIIGRFNRTHADFRILKDKVAIQLNDTHPAIAIAELMRVLIDEHLLPWEMAWEQTVGAFGYTNHTLLPEALERWPVALFERLLPRHLEIIYEINRRVLREVQITFPYDEERVRRMSLIEEGPERLVRMAHLAVVGSHSVNGVAKLHSDLVRSRLLRDFSELWPERFNNKTNGVTPRRWLSACNPGLSELITEKVGIDWITDLDQLRGLEPSADDPAFLARLAEVKLENKWALARLIQEELSITVDPASIFDVQIKRLHEYKRQLLNALHIVALYVRSKQGEAVTPRTFIFGAKAAPGYRMAKLIIQFIHAVAEVVNGDRRQEVLRVAFMPNYRVSLAEKIIPAADVSEQISTAGMEASGTGNMKLAMNGALTVGTLDGANIEIRDAVGPENFFLFGLDADQVEAKRRERFKGITACEADPVLREVVSLIASGFFSPEDRGVFQPLLDAILGVDPYLTLGDFSAYAACQRDVEKAYADRSGWARKAALNIARMGTFSSDRTIREYGREIWGVEPVEIEIDAPLSLM
ncbi:glycogen/starch/alpha-glucan phosphorylase [Chondromyces apiculatus]|uniref:Alpha-1,4 glucan phosphorylase n=1 Tax=Chondromyces apiculatus DSM 436 TaxID=1192034 RepID=A0A017T8L3_9BACT|nr:glycogen/starch/alpha-glucan phosphorylase [Chondromyces apiculatus]EYF05322.1 Glycogen phosphorylase [Chondromyces apiculatus DSM 436]